MADIFVSYARPDEARAAEVAEALRTLATASGATMSFLPTALTQKSSRNG